MSKSISPTQRTMAALRDAGWVAEKVEQRLPIPGRFVTRDMGGFADGLAWAPGKGILAWQATSGAHLSDHVEKIKALPKAHSWLRSGGRIEVWAWRKLKLFRGSKAIRWEPIVEEVRLECFEQDGVDGIEETI